MTAYPKIMIITLSILCMAIGWTIKAVSVNNRKLELSTSMAWGFDEQRQMWNRIRVDEHGHVLCKGAVTNSSEEVK